MGRETFLLPVSWPEDGWPVILEPGVRVPLVGRSPAGVTWNPAAPERFDDGRDWRDDFTEAKLAPSWIMLRAPQETWWQMNPSTGQLLITPRADVLSGRANPSFLARRVQHARFTASTSVAAPVQPGVSAGLAVFQGEKHHYFLAVRREGEGEGVTAYLEQHNGGTPETIAQQTLGPVTAVQLRVVAADDTCAFAVAVEDGDWRTVVDAADAKLLTTGVAGGFVGATVGVHARLDP
jgi:alpha-N-arabinofuranosidase